MLIRKTTELSLLEKTFIATAIFREVVMFGLVGLGLLGKVGKVLFYCQVGHFDFAVSLGLKRDISVHLLFYLLKQENMPSLAQFPLLEVIIPLI